MAPGRDRSPAVEYETAEGGLVATSGVMVGSGDHAGYVFYGQADARLHSGEVDRWHGVVHEGQLPVPEPPANLAATTRHDLGRLMSV